MNTVFSVITPSRGSRPRALVQAIRSLEDSAARAGLATDSVELLVGFDGVKCPHPETSLPSRFVDFRKTPGDFGNIIRDRLIRVAKGRHLLFLDDDNAYTPLALSAFLRYVEHEMIIGRIDVSRAFEVSVIPAFGEPTERCVRQGNIDPLCLCLSRELVLTRCGGWNNEGGYESDFLNIRRYHRRARGVALLDEVVGVYDAGAGLDPQGINPRQARGRNLADLSQ